VPADIGYKLMRELKQLFFGRRRSIGVTVFSFLLIASSIMHVHKLIVDVAWYADTYSYMPAWMILLRYSFSWLQRVLGILAAVGLLALNDAARKLAIAIGIFTILTVYWKHPYIAYKAHAEFLDDRFGLLFHQLGAPAGFKISSYTMAAVVLNGSLDVIFCATLIYFLTRPVVRDQFKKDI
jgi:hypothetical protein